MNHRLTAAAPTDGALVRARNDSPASVQPESAQRAPHADERGSARPVTADWRVAVVMITRDRRDNVLSTLPRLLALPEQPPIVVVDNASSDGTVEAIRQQFSTVTVLAAPKNLGAAARTIGVRAVEAPYIAFADDDSWWVPGSLSRAADLLDADPTLALVAARVLVGERDQIDPTCLEMAASPLPRATGLPGPAVLGFIACGAVVRRSAYLDCGGFHPAFGVGGEEEVLAIDLAAAGWSLAYVGDVVAHHHPSPRRDTRRRRQIVTRNSLWGAWLRRPLPAALAITARSLTRAAQDQPARAGVIEAARGLPWVLRERRPAPTRVQRALHTLDKQRVRGTAGPRPATPAVESLAPATLDLSVVVPTYKRDDLLLRCLKSLAEQTYPRDRFEVIVVDDARSRSAPAAVAAFGARYPDLYVRVLPGAGRGPAAARNIGWRAARGEVIAFIDDDAYPATAGWLAAGRAGFTDEHIAGVDGPVEVPADNPPTDFQRNVQGLERGTFITCNAFYRRRWLERVGGFDEAFAAPYREDSDLQFRIEAAGGALVRNPEARVIHPAAPGPFAISLKLQRYSRYNALMYRKHPARYRRELERRPPLHYYGIIAGALTCAAMMFGGRRTAALAPALLWAGLTGRFFLRRARGTSRRPRHLADLLLTSLLIPWLSVYNRLRGALQFQTPFL